MIWISILFTIVAFLFVIMYLNAKEHNNNLMKLNSKLNEDVTELVTKNAMLHSEVISRTEERAIPVGTTITWLDKQKETETGSVLDDYKHKDKTYVVVIRLKDGKTQGAPISIPLDKIIIS
jgi:hypothetical protein